MSDDSEGDAPVFNIHPDALETSELTLDQVQRDLRCLSEALGETLLRITDFEVSGTNELIQLHHLAESISFFDENETLNRLLDRFESSPEAYSHIPTLFFARYILGGSDEIEFEPDPGDILLDWQGESVTFEFKRPRMSEGNKQYWQQHRDVLDELITILDDDFQYDIRYDAEHYLNLLFPLLEAAVGDLNSPGRTRLRNGVEVNLQETEGFNDETPIGSMIFPGSMMDKDTGDWLPMTTYAGPEATFSIAGPKIDETEKLANLVDGARKQLNEGTPNVVVIHTGDMMDSIGNLKRKAQGMFKASSNTRLNAVVLWDYHYTNDGEVEVTSRTVRNPYAANDLPSEFFDSLPNLYEEVVSN